MFGVFYSRVTLLVLYTRLCPRIGYDYVFVPSFFDIDEDDVALMPADETSRQNKTNVFIGCFLYAFCCEPSATKTPPACLLTPFRNQHLVHNCKLFAPYAVAGSGLFVLLQNMMLPGCWPSVVWLPHCESCWRKRSSLLEVLFSAACRMPS